ncbi:hypothetical protein N7470_000341 [Penicillium chermesinum]|nr:hypothetical protein N7470_000341 [Penicillium chermesinum]
MSLYREGQTTAMGPPAGQAYRTPIPLPFELAQHTGIFFEEKLYTQALTLLFNTLSSGTYASKHALLPRPQHLSLAVTLLVHPSTTTRAKSAEEKEAAGAALRLLRLLITLVRPQEAGLGEAFSFTLASSRSGRRQNAENNSASTESEHVKGLQIDLSTSNSLWTRAQDFWHAVGWAFNCSVNHPERWERWQIWLSFMCDVIEDDWNDRVAALEAEEGTEQSETESDHRRSRVKERGDRTVLRESLLYQYMTSGASSGRLRRITRAIFADGSSTSVNEFGQVFSTELKALGTNDKTESVKKRVREVNIDQEEYGDYLEDETDGDNNDFPGLDGLPSVASTPQRGTRSAPDPAGAQPVKTADAGQSSHGTGVSSMGGIHAIGLRKRLLQFLAQAASFLPGDFEPVYNLFHLFVEHIRPLPLPVFQAIVSPFVTPELSDAGQTTLCELLIARLQESAAPRSDEDYMTQAKLEDCLLPYAAASSTVADNAKISILLEALIILLADDGMLVITPTFKKALESGIQRRSEQLDGGSRRGRKNDKKSSGSDSFELVCLIESAERLVYLMDLVPQDNATGTTF